MKSLILILIYFGTFFGLYFAFSLFGLIWSSYHEIVSDTGWFIFYTLFFGCWLSIFPTREYYLKNEAYFDDPKSVIKPIEKVFTKEEIIQKHIDANPSRKHAEYEAFVRDAMAKLDNNEKA